MCTTLLDEQVMARRVIAPTYFYPEVTDGWANVVMAAMYINAVMVNPDSGPGAQKLQGFRSCCQAESGSWNASAWLHTIRLRHSEHC